MDIMHVVKNKATKPEMRLALEDIRIGTLGQKYIDITVRLQAEKTIIIQTQNTISEHTNAPIGKA